MKRSILILALLGSATGAQALTIVLDYSHDTFFAGNATAKAAVDAAAADLGAAILPTLGAVTTDFYSATSGATTVSLDWSLTYSNPVTGATETLSTFSYTTDTITIYVGMKVITTGGTLGTGGPGGASFSRSISGFDSEFTAASTAVNAASNASMGRGGGPIIGSLSGTSTFESTSVPYVLNYGSMVGKISLDSDSNNDSLLDSDATLAAYWHYDHTTPVAVGKNDMYSVALHEMIHALGIGASDSWDDLHSGTTWTGSKVISITGTGTGMLSSGEDHIVDSFFSTRLSDGGSQEVVMDPSITTGTRKSLTLLDLAFLEDIGYAVVPEPASGALLLAAGCLLPALRRRKGR